METRYCPVLLLMDALFIIMNGGPVLPGFLSSMEAYSSTVRFPTINRGPVLTSFSFLNEARYCPVSYY